MLTIENLKMIQSNNINSKILQQRITTYNELKSKVTDRLAEQDQILQTIENIEREESSVRAEVRESESRLNRAGQDVIRAKEMVDRMKNQGSDSISAFPPSTRDILKQIEMYERDRKWRGTTPIGPLGRFVKITDEKFTNVIESLLDQVLNGYAVDNDHDYQLLQKILHHFRVRAPVFKARFRKEFNFEAGRPDRSLTTAFDVLNVFFN